MRDGKFATKPVDEAPGGLNSLGGSNVGRYATFELSPEDRAGRDIEDLVEAVELAAPGQEWKAQAREQVRALAPDVEEQAFGEHWGKVEQAYELARRFEDDPDLASQEEAVANSLVEIEDYFGVNAGDRPGEGDYGGYDYSAMKDDLAQAWREELRGAARALAVAQRETTRTTTGA
ncbi:hypothetical protein [Oerskovia merdavium]|uniref:Uncharacterized protein n=1 Tax=Oerskovia merdavium TaxID=2762227 RepID=A0ABR8U433_9CELL|nr:hypothetical protein [Oerskovia merdavium]MBD7982786.1 hypothetical protein [Oerskovia merdavium]